MHTDGGGVEACCIRLFRELGKRALPSIVLNITIGIDIHPEQWEKSEGREGTLTLLTLVAHRFSPLGEEHTSSVNSQPSPPQP